MPELQRRFAAEPVAVHSHRSTVDIRSTSKADLIVIRCRGGDGDLAWLCMARSDRPETVIVLVVPESALDLEWGRGGTSGRTRSWRTLVEDRGWLRLAVRCMPTPSC